MPLLVTIPKGDLWDKKTKKFIRVPKDTQITLEHSLISVAKWEAKWKHAFLSQTHKKTTEETIDYIRCMTIGPAIDPLWYYNIPREEYDRILAYIDEPMSAVHYPDEKKQAGNTFIAWEHIYCWMTIYNIPFECEKWHLNKLLSLIKMCSLEQKKSKSKKAPKLSESSHIDRATRNAMMRKKYEGQ